MQKYRRVALKDRIEIQAHLLKGMNVTEIAKILNFHKTTVSREIKRNPSENLYMALGAEKKAKERFRRCKKSYKVTEDFSELIVKKLQSGWSPEQIAGRLKLEGSNFCGSYQSIYRFIRRNNLDKATLLRLGYKRRGLGRLIQQRQRRESSWKLPLAQRPQPANERTELGHWERDLFFGANRKTVLILSDRKSRYVILKKTKNFKSCEMAAMTNKLMNKLPAKTMTNDNGSEFYDVKALSIPVYFCEVQKPQQRGTVENSIGLLRQYIKRKTNLDEISDQKIKALERKINLRPRKILDYKTPYEVFYGQTVALAK